MCVCVFQVSCFIWRPSFERTERKNIILNHLSIFWVNVSVNLHFRCFSLMILLKERKREREIWKWNERAVKQVISTFICFIQHFNFNILRFVLWVENLYTFYFYAQIKMINFISFFLFIFLSFSLFYVHLIFVIMNKFFHLFARVCMRDSEEVINYTFALLS